MDIELKDLMAKMEEFNKSVLGIRESHDKVISEVKGFGSQIAGMDTRLLAMESGLRTRTIPNMPGVEGKKFSLQRLICAIVKHDWSDAPYEKEVVLETGKKALSVGTTTAGGYLVPPEAIPELIEMLRAKSVARELGATVLDGLTGSPVTIPTQTGGATGYWVAENAAIDGSDQATGQVSLTPHEAGAMTKISNRLIRLSNPGVEKMVRDDIAKVLTLLIDLACLRGSGSSNQPTGIANTASINTLALGTNGATPSIDNLFAMLYKLELSNVDIENLGWAFHPRTWNTLRGLKDGENRYYLTPDVGSLSKGSLLGFKYRTTTQIPIILEKGNSGAVCSEIYLANWGDLILALWGGMEIAASDQTSDAFEKNQTWIRIIQECDVKVRHAASFCYCADALA